MESLRSLLHFYWNKQVCFLKAELIFLLFDLKKVVSEFDFDFFISNFNCQVCYDLLVISRLGFMDGKVDNSILVFLITFNIQ